VLGCKEEEVRVKVLNEGKPGMLGVLGGEDAEVEVALLAGKAEDCKQMLQDILDKMDFLAVADGEEKDGRIELTIKGEDLGRIIGKEGNALKSLETLVGSIASNVYGERVRVGVDAGGYREKREQALERLAKDVVDEVAKTGQEKIMPQLDARDRRTIHMFLKDNPQVESHSEGEGKSRRLVITPRR